jgi:hypothetical protein
MTSLAPCLETRRRAIRLWLLAVAALIFVTVIVGGATRLNANARASALSCARSSAAKAGCSGVADEKGGTGAVQRIRVTSMAHGSVAADQEYLFGVAGYFDDMTSEYVRWVVAFPIVKKTAKRIFYKRTGLRWPFEDSASEISRLPANEYVAVTDRDDEGPVMGRAAAAELLRRLLAAGLSRFEPDPINALARVEAERARQVIAEPAIERT